MDDINIANILNNNIPNIWNPDIYQKLSNGINDDPLGMNIYIHKRLN